MLAEWHLGCGLLQMAQQVRWNEYLRRQTAADRAGSGGQCRYGVCDGIGGPVAARTAGGVWCGADGTISAHCWRWHIHGVRSWPRRLVDGVALILGDENHCLESYKSEVEGQQLPPEMRE